MNSQVTGTSSSSIKEENNVPVISSKGPSRSPSPTKKSVIETRRAEQNRAAQRAFRQRKERYVKELEAKVNSMADWPARMEQLELENEQLKRKLKQLEDENKSYKSPKLTYSSSAPKYIHTSNDENTTTTTTTTTTTIATNTHIDIQQQQLQSQQPQQKVVGEKGKVLDDLVSILRTRHRPPIPSHPPN